MERELSTGATLGVLLFALVTTLSLGVGVYALAEKTDFGQTIQPINSTLLTVTTMLSWVALLIAWRLSWLSSVYYDKRFKFTSQKGGVLQVQYLKNRKMSIFQILVFLFKPVRFKQIEDFILKGNKELTLTGEFEVIEGLLLINGYYLEANTSLFEYIGDKVSLTIVGNHRQVIEKNISDYTIQSVEVLA